MNILLTGGAGFIGSHICSSYAEIGHKVFALDRQLVEKTLVTHPNVEWLECDITDSDSVEEIFHKHHFHLVSHHAAQRSVRGVPTELALGAWNNVLGTYNLLSAAIRYCVPRFVFASSGTAIYGNPTTLPTPEGYPLYPLSPYGISKLQCEALLPNLVDCSSTKYCILRYANVYGPGQKPLPGSGVIPAFINRMLNKQAVTIRGTGSQERDFVYIDDVVNANVVILEKEFTWTYPVFNIGTGIGISVYGIYTRLAQLIEAAKPLKGDPPQKGEVERIFLDCTKAKDVLNWEPKIDLWTGLKLTLGKTF